MSYKDKISAVVDTLDLGKVEFEVVVNAASIRVHQEKWNANIGGSFYNELVNGRAVRRFNVDKNKFYIESSIVSLIKSDVIYDLKDIYCVCSPAKNVRATKGWKRFNVMLNDYKYANNIDKEINTLFDICEYHYSVTRTDSIISATNNVHRTNIFQLLSLMEKSYGKEREKISNK